jgi:DNA repair protein RecO (recombination protein O)
MHLHFDFPGIRVSQRNLVYEALIIRAKESPGGSRILTMMTAEAGLVDVFVFGGPKSKLRSLASPYAAGRAFIYLDPVKDFLKLSDFDARDSFPALREDLGRIWAAGFIAELLIKTSGGGGDFPLVLELALDALGALDQTPPGRSDAPLLIFLWRLLNLLGIGPDPTTCSSCGAELHPIQGGPSFVGSYSFSQEAFLCPSCAAHADRSLDLATGAMRWLSRCLELSFAQAATLPLLPETAETLKRLLFGLARSAAEAPLASLGAGELVQ